MKTQRGSKMYSSHLGARWGWLVNVATQSLYPRQRPVTHCIGGWVGPRAGLSGCGKSRHPPGIDAQSVQPLVSRYTDCAIPGHNSNI
jgi:hypothetical protein